MPRIAKEGGSTVWRVIAATLCASVAFIPIALILVSVLPGQDTELFGVYVAAGYVVSLTCVVVIGIPTYLVLKKYRISSARNFAAIGFVLPLGFVIVAQPFGKDGIQTVLLQGLLFGTYGLVSALVFWWIAARRALN